MIESRHKRNTRQRESWTPPMSLRFTFSTLAVRLGDDAELTAMFDMEYVEQWVIRLGADVQQLWERLKRAAGCGWR